MSDKFDILSVEDNEPDFNMLKMALNRIPDLELNIVNIKNGKDALDYIFKKNGYKEVKTPDLIVLDINLPKLSGLEIVKKIKTNKKYKVIPVIMFSTSDTEEDINESYLAHANSYIVKTQGAVGLFEKIATMGEYWLKSTKMAKADNICIIKKSEKK